MGNRFDLQLVILLGFALTAHAQQQQPFTLRVETQLVIETVTVKDSDGRPIEGLTARDFVITEDNVPQTLSVFDFQKLNNTPLPPIQPQPVFLPDGSTIPPVTPTVISAGRAGDIKYRDRRLVVLYFDTMTMGPAEQYRAFTAARKFIQTDMAEPDLMAILHFSKGVVRVLLDFTDDREKLDQTVLTLMYPEDDDDDDLNVVDTAAAFGQNSGEFNIFNTDRQLAALQTAVKMLGVLSERKSLVYFAGGLRLNGVDNQAQLRATINAAIRSNVSLYPVDARGLVARAPLGDAIQSSPGGLGVFTGATANAALLNFQRSQDTLYVLGADTGGKAMLDYNDLSRGIIDAQQAVSSYYILGYYTTNAARDGKYRRIKITLSDGQSATLDYRQGYFAPKEFGKFTASDKERQLEEALMLEDPITDLTIAMEVNYFQLNSAEYYVPITVKIPGSELVLAQSGGAERTLIDFIGEVKDNYGTTYSNMRDKIDIRLSGERASELAVRPIQYDSGFTLLPGKYVLKLLARDAETGRIGTYQTSFTVPNLVREVQRVPISSVVLSSQRVDMKDALQTVGKDKAQAANPLVHDGQKLIPSVTRVFSKSRDLHVYFQAYQRDATTMRPVVTFVTFYRGQNKAFETPPLSAVEGMDPKSKAVPLRFSVSLNQLPPGEYNCQVTVLDPETKKASFWQAPIMLVP